MHVSETQPAFESASPAAFRKIDFRMKNLFKIIFILCFVVAILLWILGTLRPKTASMRRVMAIITDCGLILFNMGIICFGLWSFYVLFHWDSGMMRKSFGDSPEWLQKVATTSLGMMGVFGGVYMNAVRIFQIRQGRWSDSGYR